jgi:hypothetical protein
MTPRERDTLETILRDVAACSDLDGRGTAKPALRPLAMSSGFLPNGAGFVLYAGDIVIDGVTFGERHGKSA